MRNPSLVVLALCAQFLLSGLTFTITGVDLDQPGAMETLARERPEHYARVQEEIRKAQAIPLEPAAVVRDALMDGRSKDATILKPSDPAQKRISVVVDAFRYEVTVRMVKNPAVLEKAK
jgi:hypothetical protein